MAAGCGLREGGVGRKRCGVWKMRLFGIRLHRGELPLEFSDAAQRLNDVLWPNSDLNDPAAGNDGC